MHHSKWVEEVLVEGFARSMPTYTLSTCQQQVTVLDELNTERAESSAVLGRGCKTNMVKSPDEEGLQALIPSEVAVRFCSICLRMQSSMGLLR
jgi:hypothetical protein